MDASQVVTCKALSLAYWRITGEASSIGVPLRFLSRKKIKGTMAREERTKRVYIELEVIEGIDPNVQPNINEIYPHSGTFLLKRTDGMMSVVNINKGIEPYGEYVTGWQEVFVPNADVMESQFVMDSRDVDEKMNAMIKRYDDDVKRRKDELEQEFEKKRMELEHQHDIRMMEIENEQPKRNSQGEWVSGKTLTEIIKTLTHQDVKA